MDVLSAIRVFATIGLLCLSTLDMAHAQRDTLPLIPKPVSLQRGDGEFRLSRTTKLVVRGAGIKSDARVFNECLQLLAGFKLKFAARANSNAIILSEDTSRASDAYDMIVSRSSITIRGNGAGVMFGLQTLLQLLPLNSSSTFLIPCLTIEDRPRYEWRGMHLDVGRHFFPKEFIKKYIDYIAMYKMNTFHWHLTEDQGWRIEIKKYPKLTEVGAWRSGSMIGLRANQQYDSIRYGGYFTQEEIKEVVAYAQDRHITIVPEIEMPGHSVAALATYPELSCTGGPFEVAKGWGIFEDVYCPKEETFAFLENVLSEVCALFPGQYIHIGGDEVPKRRWKDCEHCQALIKKEGLNDEHELQSYFIRRIEKFLNAKGKKLIGWDEILEGGLAPNATVMSWRGAEGGIAAAKQKHYAVMNPTSHCYFDYYQGNPAHEPLAIGGHTTVEKVYSYEPTPSELSDEEQKYILGAQGNVWTEYILTPEHVEYMAIPRMAALAEVVWRPKGSGNFEEFRQRLIQHFTLLDRMNVNYSRALYELKTKILALGERNGVALQFSSPFGNGGIFYTLDGTEPTMRSVPYQQPINIQRSTTVKAAYFEADMQRGPTIAQEFCISKSTGKTIELVTLPDQKWFGDGATTLVDGVRGDLNRYGTNWIGFSGKNLEATVDLLAPQSISKITIDVYDGEGSWIHLPRSVEAFVSTDGKTYVSVCKLPADEIKRAGKVLEMNIGNQTARYVKVFAENAGKIPEGKPGAGKDAWLFVDEIIVE